MPEFDGIGLLYQIIRPLTPRRRGGDAMTDTVPARELSGYLDAVVDLTRQYDSQALISTLLGTLCERIQAGRVRLFTLTNDKRDSEFGDENIDSAKVVDLFDPEFGEPRPLSDDQDLYSCVKTQKVISRDVAGGRRVVFPVFGVHNIRALLVVEELRDAHVSYELLAKLLRVYSNQAFMLARTELDPLTGLFNRQSFYERIRRVAQGADNPHRRADDTKPVSNCFALFDIDHFKDVNDRYGHLYGDEVLLLFSRLMTQSFRSHDLLFRYGGEEFAVVLTNVDLDNAEHLLERFRRTVEAYTFPRIGPKTISIGFTEIKAETGLDKIVMYADKALYYAKNNGRNQVCCYEKLITEGKLVPVQVAEGDIELF